MKNKLTELNVDFIGGLGSLTKEEEIAISEFIRKDKEKRNKKQLRSKPATKRKAKDVVLILSPKKMAQ